MGTLERLLPMDARPVIQIDGVTYSFPNGINALLGVNATIHEGEFVALIGRNGSGKSTLLKHMNGLLKPSRGRVIVGGLTTDRLDAVQLAQMVGLVFQNPDHMLFKETVEEEVSFGPRNLGLSRSEVEERVERALDLAGLGSLRDESPFLMTRGLRKQVALASVISMKPKVLAVDEPTIGLDYLTLNEVVNIIRRFHAEGGTVILVTHDVRLVADFATRTLLMDSGRLIADAPTRQIMTSASLPPNLVYAPQVTRLAKALHGLGIRPDALTIDEFRHSFATLRQASVHAHVPVTDHPVYGKLGTDFVLSVENLRCKYQSSGWVINDVSFAVRSGEALGVVGPMGAGKSTLLMCLMGLIPNTVSGTVEGRVSIMGMDAKGRKPADLAAHVGLIFEDPEAQFVSSTVEDDVAFGMENIGVQREEMVSRVKQALEDTGLTGFESRNPHELSGGEKQRVALAAILAMRPRILLLDEPSSELDPHGKEELFAVLAQLKQAGVTIVIAEKDTENLALIADRVIILKEGVISYDGPTRDIFGRATELVRAGIRPPEIPQLFEELRRTGLRFSEYPLSVKEAVDILERELGGGE